MPEYFPLFAGEITQIDLKEILHARKEAITREDLKQVKYYDRITQFALAASLEAFQDAGLDLKEDDPRRVGVLIGTGLGGISSLEMEFKRFSPKGCAGYRLSSFPGFLAIWQRATFPSV